MHKFRSIKLSALLVLPTIMLSVSACLPQIPGQNGASNEKEIAWMFGGITAWANPVSFSPDGKYILTMSKAGKLWNAETGRLIHAFRLGDDYPLGWSPCQFSPDGKYVAFADSNHICLWNIETENVTRTFTGHKGFVKAIAITQSGDMMATGGADSTILIWSINSGDLIRAIPPHKERISALQFVDSDGQLLVQEYNGTIALWNAHTGAMIHTFRGDMCGLLAGDSTHGGSQIAFYPFNRKGKPDYSGLNIYNLRTGRLVYHVIGRTRAESLWEGISPDGSRFATLDRDILKVFDGRTGAFLFQTSPQVEYGPNGPIVFTQDGKYIACLSDVSGVVLLSATDGHLVKCIGPPYSGRTVTFSPDSKYCLFGNSAGQLYILDMASGKVIRTLADDHGYIEFSLLSPDGSKLVAADQYGEAVVLDVRDGSQLWRRDALVQASAGSIYAGVQRDCISTDQIAFSQDGKLLAILTSVSTYDYNERLSTQVGSEIDLYDATTGRLRGVLPAPDVELRPISFSNGGKQILGHVCDQDSVLVWNISSVDSPAHLPLMEHLDVFDRSPQGLYRFESNDELGWVRIFKAGTDSMIARLHVDEGHAKSAEIVGGDSVLVTTGSADYRVKCWSLPSGELLRSFRAPSVRDSEYLCGSASPSGRYFAWGDYTGNILIQDLHTGEIVKKFSETSGWNDHLIWSADEKCIYLAAFDGTVMCWNVNLRQ